MKKYFRENVMANFHLLAQSAIYSDMQEDTQDFLHEIKNARHPTITLQAVIHRLAINVINFCVYAEEKISTLFLFKVLQSLPILQPGENWNNKEIFFSELYQKVYQKSMEQLQEIEKRISNEEREAWLKLPVNDHAETYFKFRNDTAPSYQQAVNSGNFLTKKYAYIPKEHRSIIDAAFAGILFSALVDKNFDRLVKDKSMDMGGLSMDEKMDIELDHEALYAYFQSKIPLELGQE